MIKLEYRKINEKITVIEFTLPPEGIEPASIRDIVLDRTDTPTVIVSGRGPIWLYVRLCAYVLTKNHALRVATHDPRLGGAVVVHGLKSDIGKIINFEEEVS